MAVRHVRLTLATLAALAALALLAFGAGALPVEAVVVRSASMDPTLHDGDRLLLHHGHDDLHRGDIVALSDPDGSGLLVKRIVAVGSDTLAIEDGVLVVGGSRVDEPWTDPRDLDGVYLGPLVVPAGEVFVLGDNRAESVDSRHFGPVPVGAVVGRIVARLWPGPGAVQVGRAA